MTSHDDRLLEYRIYCVEQRLGAFEVKLDLALLEIAKLKLSASIWGAVSGLAVVALGIAAKALGVHI